MVACGKDHTLVLTELGLEGAGGGIIDHIANNINKKEDCIS